MFPKTKTSTPPQRKNRGFTLIEMLLVVAIIAVLISVSIPMVADALENAREATDEANERAAYTAAIEAYLTGITGDAYLYDAESGRILSYLDPHYKDAKPYGKCAKHKDGLLTLGIELDGTIKMLWTGYSRSDDDYIPHHVEWQIVN